MLKEAVMDEKRTTEEIYKSIRKQKRKSIRFAVILVILLLIMAAVSVYFIVFDNIDSFLALFQK